MISTRNSPRFSLALFVALAFSADSFAEIPKLPGATSRVRWDVSGAPFDVVVALKLPPAERNGATLYLDALCDFTTETFSCYQTPQPDRYSKTRDRHVRYTELTDELKNNPKADKTLIAEYTDALIADYAEGLAKVREAQKRPECVFETGLSFVSLIPHVQSTRQIARVIHLKAGRDIANGNLDAVFDDLELVLRMSDDVRRRGFLIIDLVAFANASIMFRDVVPELMASKKFTVKDCDRLLKLIREYRIDVNARFISSCQIEYISIRSFLHDIEHAVGDLGRRGKPPREGESDSRSKVFADFVGVPAGEDLLEFQQRLDLMTTKDHRNEVNWLDLTYFRMTQALSLPYADRKKQLEAITEEAVANTLVLSHTMPSHAQAMNAFVRSEALQSGTECLVAVKRWQLAHPDLKQATLQTILAESGATEIPLDPFAGRSPMRIAWIDDKPVVYSLGSDVQDQGGTADWNDGTQPGDYLFHMK